MCVGREYGPLNSVTNLNCVSGKEEERAMMQQMQAVFQKQVQLPSSCICYYYYYYMFLFYHTIVIT